MFEFLIWIYVLALIWYGVGRFDEGRDIHDYMAMLYAGILVLAWLIAALVRIIVCLS